MSKFPQFPLLPAELQLLVWYFALPDARTIHITNIDTPLHGTTELYEPVRSKHPPPALLAACRASREVFLNNYETICGNPKQHDQPSYFDPRRDILYLDLTWHSYVGDATEKFRSLASENVLQSIRYVALEYTPWSQRWAYGMADWIVAFMKVFTTMETLSFVFNAPCVCCQGHLFRFPLGLLQIPRGSRFWPFKRRIRWKLYQAAQWARQKYPEQKLPKFEVKRIEKLEE